MRVAVVVGLVVASLIAVEAPASAAPSWKLVPTGAGVRNGHVAAVACPTTTICFAVGTTDRPNSVATMVQRWNGTKWVGITTPLPTGSVSSQLTSVACTSAINCFAVGQYNNIVPATKTLILRWNGQTWSILPSPNVASSPVNLLTGVACPSATSCFAVGSSFVSTTDSSAQRTLIERWNGTAWAIMPSPNQPIANDSALTGVSCSSITHCFAVGNYTNQLVTSTLTERFDGTSWTVVSSPNPGSSTDNELIGVTCSSSSNCVAVGTGHGTLVETWNGSSWAIVPSATPSLANGASLTGVACPTVARCFAVGIFIRKGLVTRLVESITASGGAIVNGVPLPSGTKQSNLSGVACASAVRCFAVGNFRTGTSRRPLFERYS